MIKKKIAILGSTGSIGKSLLNIVNKNLDKVDIVLLTTNTNYKELFKQAKKYRVKNLIISKKSHFNLAKLNNNNNFNLYNNFNGFKKIFKKKIQYTINAISGIDGLEPTLKIIKHTKTIAIANKEAIICGWNLIKKKLKKNKTFFIPIDSEHFSIWFALNSYNSNEIEKIYITASGGPFHDLSFEKFKKATIKEALNHPNWSMGKKITIDSATMINKVFEVIEANKIFNISYNKIRILIHKDSYVHAVLKFKNGMIKIIAHDTTMEIPIFNSLNFINLKSISSNEIDLKKLSNLNFQNLDNQKFKIKDIIQELPKKNSLFETVLVSANDELVKLFLDNKIFLSDINKYLLNFLKLNEFKQYKKIEPSTLSDILKLKNYVSNKIKNKFL